MPCIFKVVIKLAIFYVISYTSVSAQSYQGTQVLNPADSGQVTASAASANGDVYIASYVNASSSPGNFGINSVSFKGEIKLTKLNANGLVKWTQTFTDSKARIFDMHLDQNGDLIFAGGYYDSLIFTPQHKYAGDQLSSSSFMAKYDTSGTHIWSKVVPSVNFYNFCSYTFEVVDSIIIESGFFYGWTGSLRKLNAMGDTLKNIQLTLQIRSVSDIVIDGSGDVYIGGCSMLNGKIDTMLISNPNNWGYLNYIAKLDRNLNPIWTNSTRHITSNFDPRVGRFGNQVALLSNDYPNGFGQPNSFNLNYFDLSGNWLHTDSVTNAYFSTSGGRLGLKGINNFLYLSKVVGDTTLQVHKIDILYSDTIIASIACRTYGNYPNISKGGDGFYYTSSFYSPMAIVNNTDTIFNPIGGAFTYLGYRQLILKFSALPCTNSDSSYALQSCEAMSSPSGKSTWSQSGTYTDTVLNAAGCDSVLTIQLTITPGDTSVSKLGNVLSSNASNAQYQWMNCNTNQMLAGETNQTFTATANGSYAVIVTENGCTDTSDCFIIANIGMKEWTNTRIKVFPNPNSGSITIQFSNESFSGELEIYSLNGQLVHQQKVESQEQLELDLSLAKDMYLLKLSSENQYFIEHLIIQ